MPGGFIATETGDYLATETGEALVLEGTSFPIVSSAGAVVAVASWERGGVATLQVLATPDGEFVVEGSVVDGEWVILRALNLTTGAYVTAISSTGLFRVETSGLKFLRVRLTTATVEPPLATRSVVD